MNSKHYKRLDLIRLFSCIAILLYHIGILKGGYLAVCTFFVLSGYLAVVSSFKKEKFSLKDYYLSRLKKIYIPLLIVVFTSIIIVSTFSNIDWINLKPETTSILLGYNNFWQLNANLDYFVRHISSPFMHLWYISILIQFEVFFPIIFILLRKLGKKLNKFVPCIVLAGLAIVSYLAFCKTTDGGNIMQAYYGTFTRLFSIFFGLLLGFIHVYFYPIVLKNKKSNRLVFLIYLLLLMIIFCIVDSKSWLFSHSMIITTIISMRLVDYSRVSNSLTSSFDKMVSSLSKISYEVYLTQYPVIFLFQNINMTDFIKVPLIILVTFVVSYIIHSSIEIRKNSDKKIFRIVSLCLILILSVLGLFKYITTKDYTRQMKKLEEDLNQNRAIIEQKQKEFQSNEQKEEDEWEEVLKDLDNKELKVKELVQNMRIVGIGDSIMELAIKNLYNQFPNGYFDAVENRTEKQANEIIKELDDKGILGNVILLNVGTNGQCLGKCKDQLMETIGDRTVFWVNTTNPDYDTFNPSLIELAEKYDNVHIIDWVSIAKEHPEYLIRDKVHPTVTGCKVYAETIFNAIYQEYLKEFNEQKEQKIKEHEEKEKSKITFIGNDLLLGTYDYLQTNYSNSDFIIDKDLNYQSLTSLLKDRIKNNSLNYNIVLMFDKSMKISKKEYEELVKLSNEHKIYIVDVDNTITEVKGANIIKFYEEINKNKNYIKFDNVHLTDLGNTSLTKMIDSYLKK